MQKKVDGEVIGVVAALDADGEPLIAYAGNESELLVVAKTTVTVSTDAINRKVALMLDRDDVTRPIIMGLVCNRILNARTRTKFPEEALLCRDSCCFPLYPSIISHSSSFE